MIAVANRQSLDSNAGGDDGLAHGHRFIDLDPRAPTNAQRNHIEGVAADVRPGVADPTNHVDLRVMFDLLQQAPRRVPADNRQRDIRNLPFDSAKYLSRKEDNSILIRQPIHGTGKHQAIFLNVILARRVIVRIDAGGYGENVFYTKPLFQTFLIRLRYGDGAGEAPTGL